jgi:hypothetical protein
LEKHVPMDCEEMTALALAALNGEELLVIADMVDGLTEPETAQHLTDLRARPYDRDRVHRIRRTALNRMRRVLAEAGVRAA